MASASGQEGFLPTPGQDNSAQVSNLDQQDEMNEAELLRIFKHFDEDGSGSISCDELRQAMMALGIKVTMSSCKKILAQIDTDGNGTIEWEEFHTFFEKVQNP